MGVNLGLAAIEFDLEKIPSLGKDFMGIGDGTCDSLIVCLTVFSLGGFSMASGEACWLPTWEIRIHCI